jgi:hypothetical protein
MLFSFNFNFFIMAYSGYECAQEKIEINFMFFLRNVLNKQRS